MEMNHPYCCYSNKEKKILRKKIKKLTNIIYTIFENRKNRFTHDFGGNMQNVKTQLRGDVEFEIHQRNNDFRRRYR